MRTLIIGAVTVMLTVGAATFSESEVGLFYPKSVYFLVSDGAIKKGIDLRGKVNGRHIMIRSYSSRTPRLEGSKF